MYYIFLYCCVCRVVRQRLCSRQQLTTVVEWLFLLESPFCRFCCRVLPRPPLEAFCGWVHLGYQPKQTVARLEAGGSSEGFSVFFLPSSLLFWEYFNVGPCVAADPTDEVATQGVKPSSSSSSFVRQTNEDRRRSE